MKQRRIIPLNVPRKAPEKVLVQMAELGIIKSIQDFLEEPLKPGRLKGAFTELEFLVDKELQIIKSKYSMVFEDNKSKIEKYLFTFGTAANWIGRETHVVSVVSFCLALLESSPYSYQEKIIKQLKVIYDYYERGNNTTIVDLYTSENFIKVWDDIKRTASVNSN